MDSKNSSGGNAPESFLAGKGFYIVLFLCAAVIAVSAWTLTKGKETVDNKPMNDIVIAAVPTATPKPTMRPVQQTPDVSLWEIPEDAVEVIAQPEPPKVEAQAPIAKTPAPQSEPVQGNPAPSAERVFIWPVRGEVETPHSMDVLLYDRTMADWRTHDGLDIAAEAGERVMAATDGVVKSVYADELYGTTVIIDHGDGLIGVYANLAELPTVTEGGHVRAGDVIGAVGATALCETGMGYHLHFAMQKDGAPVDPRDYLPEA